jgi:hypothetical protein
MIRPKIFYSFDCLTEKSPFLKASELQKKWFRASDKRYMAQTLQKLIDYNINRLSFLRVSAFLSGSDKDLLLNFKSENFIGVIPIRSPESGKILADFHVTPRFITTVDKFKEYTELVQLIGEDMSPEFDSDLDLFSPQNFTPPLYFESIKLVDLLLELTKKPWKKFKAQEKITGTFKGNINWQKYLEKDFCPEYKFKIPTRYNTLSEEHKDYEMIKYVFNIASSEILSERTPLEIRQVNYYKIQYINSKLKAINTLPTNFIPINSADLLLIKATKNQANTVLRQGTTSQKAWRVDYSEVFEKTIQYLFKLVSKEIGGSVFTNFNIKNNCHNNFSWELSHLEPDIVFVNNKNTFFIDAKYKSHLFNKYSNSIFLKEEFRRDLHQILAYSSFNKLDNKLSFLCYPSTEPFHIKNSFKNPLNNTSNTIILLGVPLDKTRFSKIKEIIRQIILDYS